MIVAHQQSEINVASYLLFEALSIFEVIQMTCAVNVCSRSQAQQPFQIVMYIGTERYTKSELESSG
jgi:hypothetical protein